MKVLIVSPNYPYPADKGDRIRINGVVRLFEELGSKIDLISLDSRIRNKDLVASAQPSEIFLISKLSFLLRIFKNLFKNQSFTSAYYFNSNFVKELDRRLSSNEYDLIVVFSSSFDYLIPLFSKYNVKIFWDLIDFDSLKWEQLARSKSTWRKWVYHREASLIKQAEIKIMQFADVVSVINLREINRYQIENEINDRLNVLPPLMEVKTIPLQDCHPRQIIFTGQMDYYPNIEAVRFFDQQVMPLIREKYPDIIFKVVGRKVSNELIRSCPQTIFTGEVQEVASHLAKSIIAVVPLKSVFGIPIKLLDALSIGLPTIVTTEVAETISAKDGEEILVANTAEEFAKEIDFLLEDAEARKQISEQAKVFINDSFSCKVVAKQLGSLISRSTEKLQIV